MTTAYPLQSFRYRELPRDYGGVVCTWDVDKTYLSTHFSSLRGLARIPVELAIDKHPIVGMPEILRALRYGSGKQYAGTPIYFVSASPPELRRTLEQRMLMDGVEFDGLVFKDWRRTLRALRPGRLREQVGFKLNALLHARAWHPAARELLFGDDVEADAVAYSLYARMMNDELRGKALDQALVAEGVARDDRDCIRSALASLGRGGGRVEGIFIHQERGRSAESLRAVGPLVVPVRGAEALRAVLVERGLIV